MVILQIKKRKFNGLKVTQLENGKKMGNKLTVIHVISTHNSASLKAGKLKGFHEEMLF